MKAVKNEGVQKQTSTIPSWITSCWVGIGLLGL